jgi:membrane protease YdiL (CAAX protease family)
VLFRSVQIIIGYLARVKLALAPWEIYLFYVNAALAEECLYRATMITFLDKIFVKMPYFNEQPVVRKLVLVVASASVFGMSHYWVYGQQPALMLTAFIGGLVLALVYVIAKHPLPPVIAHVINNMAASYQTIQSMSVVSVAAVFTPVAVPFVAIAWLAIGIVIVARGKTRKRPVLEGIETVI